jgi:hypothetical protein
MKFSEIDFPPEAQAFFDNSKISFSATLEKGICHLRSKLPWDCGLFLLSIFNIFIAIIETVIRAIIFTISALSAHPQKNNALYNLIFTSSIIYFSAKFIGMSLFRNKLDQPKLHYNDPVHRYTTKQSYERGEKPTRRN